MASLRERIVTLVRWLRDPHQKPPITAEVDRRLDRVEQRINRIITIDSANAAQRQVREHR